MSKYRAVYMNHVEGWRVVDAETYITEMRLADHPVAEFFTEDGEVVHYIGIVTDGRWTRLCALMDQIREGGLESVPF